MRIRARYLDVDDQVNVDVERERTVAVIQRGSALGAHPAQV